jgi:LysR family transcriptional regulator of gallate degradation
MSSYPNLRHVRLFQFAAETNSLTRAAEAVRVSQPAASQAIAKLEGQFGGALFERRGSGVFVTERGRLLTERAARALSLLREANERLARHASIGRALAIDLLETHATIAHLRAVAAFASTSSFTAAARRLEQAEPSVQRAARELERIGTVPLFEGRQNSIRLTATGTMLARAASLVLRELENALEDARELDGRFTGRVVIGTLPFARTRIVPEAIVAWTNRRPAASIEIVDGSYDTLAHALAIGEIDMLVGALRPASEAKGIAQEALFDDPLSVVVRAGHPLAARPELKFEDLRAYPWILPRKGTPTRAIFDELSARHGLAQCGSGLVETGSLVALRGLLVNSDRLTLMSRRQIAYEENSGLLVPLKLSLPATARPIGIATRQGWMPTTLQAELLDALRVAAKSL